MIEGLCRKFSLCSLWPNLGKFELTSRNFDSYSGRSCQFLLSPHSICGSRAAQRFQCFRRPPIICHLRQCALRRLPVATGVLFCLTLKRKSAIACPPASTLQYLQYLSYEAQTLFRSSRDSASHTACQVVDWSDRRNAQCSTGRGCPWAALRNAIYVQSGNYYGVKWERHSEAWGCSCILCRILDPSGTGQQATEPWTFHSWFGLGQEQTFGWQSANSKQDYHGWLGAEDNSIHGESRSVADPDWACHSIRESSAEPAFSTVTVGSSTLIGSGLSAPSPRGTGSHRCS